MKDIYNDTPDILYNNCDLITKSSFKTHDYPENCKSCYRFETCAACYVKEHNKEVKC